MRLFYFLLRITLPYTLRIFYPRRKLINTSKNFFGRTIYVSNHAASFMDPLVIGGLKRPIVFFMTRSDVFTALTRPILWAAHMLPIYRERDGVNTKSKNDQVFEECSRILSFGRNLLIFGEGFTDEVFIRRLKPVKKGAVRIGFFALEQQNWKKKIYLAAIGCNYSDPHQIGSDLLISTSKRICLNDYKEQYLANANKCVNELTLKLEKLMRDQITHVDAIELTEFHEQLMMLTRKGMNPVCTDFSIPLEKRWRYSQKLANWMNDSQPISESVLQLKERVSIYFSKLKEQQLEEDNVYHSQKGKLSISKELFYMIVTFPLAILGAIHCAPGYLFIKRFVEGKFKRPDFWPSVKLLMGMLVIGLYNIPFIFLFKAYIYPNGWLALLYYLSIGIFGMIAYHWFKKLKIVQAKIRTNQVDLQSIIQERRSIVEEIKRLIPVA